MFAANRNDRVIGRTSVLIVSIRTRNGFSHVGAPSGRKWAIVALGLKDVLDIIKPSHRGRPRIKVIIR